MGDFRAAFVGSQSLAELVARMVMKETQNCSGPYVRIPERTFCTRFGGANCWVGEHVEIFHLGLSPEVESRPRAVETLQVADEDAVVIILILLKRLAVQA